MCDCQIVNNDGDNEIEYCPLHAAAPAMLEACKFALMGYQNIIDFNLLPGQYNEDTQKHIDKLSAAIAAAKPVSKDDASLELRTRSATRNRRRRGLPTAGRYGRHRYHHRPGGHPGKRGSDMVMNPIDFIQLPVVQWGIVVACFGCLMILWAMK